MRCIRAGRGMEMVDLENVIRGLECCRRGFCFSCPYNDGIDENVECKQKWADDALSLLKVQEARVMTLEEIEDALDNVVWLDIPGAENLADGFSLIMAYSRKNGFVLLDSPFGDNPSQDRFEYTDYNKTWRCWTARPTDEQREAVKWDG